MEHRDMKVIINKVGGTASPTAVNYKISIPSKWAKDFGITKDNRCVTMTYDSDHQKIIISPVDQDEGWRVDTIEVQPEIKLYNKI